MGSIRVLPPVLVNRIAAGECIERPASVVKELVENALDAGAHAIDLAIEEGGRTLLRITDDGCGMDADDLTLSVTPHATSKIRTDEDLFSIHTMGFRGEALPSIGAVARLRIVSRPADADVAHEIQVEGGQISPAKPCAAPPGTTVEVRDLFYCVPARRKFLRTNQTETGHITEQLARIALPHAQVAFTLRNRDRLTHKLVATSDTRQRIADLYGAEIAESLLPIERANDHLRLYGFVAPPANSRGSSKWEYVFVNGRFVRDKFVSHAIKEAYRSLIDPSRYPVAFLFLTVDPAHVDVNVHPTKTEIRWRDSNFVHSQVLSALREKFQTTNLDHSFRPAAESDEYRERVRAAMVDFFTKSRPTPQTPPLPSFNAPPPQTAALPALGGSAVAPRETSMPAPADAAPWPVTPPVESAAAPEPTADDANYTPPAEHFIQVHNAYLIVETADGLMIVDQHALHERILYEELRKRMTERRLEAQRLLMPLVMQVPADRLETLETHEGLLTQLGIELAAAGPQSVALHAFPTLLQERVDQERFVRDLLDLLAEKGSQPGAETLVHDVLDMMACKAAVKAGDPLTPTEIQALLERRAVAERSSHCPHGRPTTLRLTLRDLEKQFHRR